LFKIAVLVSGSGSNLQAIIDAIDNRELNVEIAMVIASNHQAFALERAQKHHIQSYVVSKKEFANCSDQILKLAKLHQVNLIVLAGYLGILNGKLLDEYNGKIINIHPALLPKYGGPGMYGHYVHEAVIKAQEMESGCTVHYVSAQIDGGEIILQTKVKVLAHDTPTTLAKRILVQEHKLLPAAIKLISARKSN
jgi:phosphoribosylglycinamide formyltransferase-1